MDYLLEGVRALFDFSGGGWKSLVMFAVGIILIWLAIRATHTSLHEVLQVGMRFLWVMTA